jgi:phosphotransferase system HPr (HPr) family protein
MHLRPAAEVAGIACSHKSEIVFSSGGKRADACSVFELLILGIRYGDLVKISVAGRDAVDAMHALDAILGACSEREEFLNLPGEDFDSFAA